MRSEIRAAEMCKAEVTTEDTVKGDTESNGLIENAIMLLRGIIKAARKNHPAMIVFSVVVGGVVGCILSR